MPRSRRRASTCLALLVASLSAAPLGTARANELLDPPLGPVWPVIISGRVVNEIGRPIAAHVVSEGLEVATSSTGEFWLVAPPSGAPILVKRPGYSKELIEPSLEPLLVELHPHPIRAAYLTYYGFIDGRVRRPVIDLVDRTELNALVIDVKGDRGWLPYKSEVPMVAACGSHGPATMRDFDDQVRAWKRRGIYLIARVVLFKDNVLANCHPEWGVGNGTRAGLWHDLEKLAWIDPMREEAWDYSLAIAKEAIDKGFDEVQFDYVRFPTEGAPTGRIFAGPVNATTRVRTISRFLERARRELGAKGAFVSADIFGYTAFNASDTDIGQKVEALSDHLDYLSPMTYPSGYHLGIPGYRDPVAHPYEVVKETVRNIATRVGDKPARVRPWIQDFRDYAFDRRRYKPSEVRLQFRGSDDGGGVGWMVWNPGNQYKRETFLGEREE